VPDLSAVKTVAGDYDGGQLADAVDRPKLVSDVIDHWLKHGGNRSTLVYGVRRAHAEHLQQRFVEAGIRAEYMDGLTSREDREATFVRFRSGETRIICNVGVLTTGVDLDVRCIIDCKPTKSEMLFVQTIGRGLRTAEGKDKLLVLDHAGNTLRLGLVTDIHHDRLDDGEPRKPITEKQGEKPEPLPVRCEECNAVLHPRTKICGQCGHVRIGKPGFVHDDGQLVRLGSRAKPSIVPSNTEKVQFHRELRWYAREKGYSQGWVYHKFREKFGRGPDGFTWGEPARPSLKSRTGSGRGRLLT
jgi:DNA repair protein RadD